MYYQAYIYVLIYKSMPKINAFPAKSYFIR
nr:MAG TPA: hypothetical protein [Caudoviricetes sp.]